MFVNEKLVNNARGVDDYIIIQYFVLGGVMGRPAPAPPP